jgi:hypothetical protein
MFFPLKINNAENIKHEYKSASEAGKSRPQSDRELLHSDFSIISRNFFFPIFLPDNPFESSPTATAKLHGFAHHPGLANQNIHFYLRRVLWTTK